MPLPQTGLHSNLAVDSVHTYTGVTRMTLKRKRLWEIRER